ncbi:hypothetical protein LPJ73_004990, partial [Coemansia sp. RSA 2703]
QKQQPPLSAGPPVMAQHASDDSLARLPLYVRAVSALEKPDNQGSKQSDSITQQQQQMRRRRRTQACEYCHLKKIKCEGDGVRCINCIKNDVECMWGLKRKRGPKPKAEFIAYGSRKGGRPSSQQQQQQPQQQPQQSQQLQQKQQSQSQSNLQQLVTQSPHPAPPLATRASTSQVPIAMILQSQSVHPSESPAQISVDDTLSDDEGPALSPPSSDTFEGLRMPSTDGAMEEFFSDNMDSDTRDTVRYYFDYFYPLCPMFHPSMFIRRVVRGDVDPLLLDAMRAASARVITKATGRPVDGAALARSVKRRILEKLEQPSVDLVRVLVIMTLLAGSQGEYMSYNSLICLASSLVVRLGWHKLDLYRRPPPAAWEEWVQLEVKRRVFWLVYQTDSYQAMLTGRPMSISEDSVYVQAPCSDYEWDVIMHNGAATNGSSASAKETPPRDRAQLTPTPLAAPANIDQKSAIVATGAFSYSFMALCELTAVISQINSFLCDAKAGRIMVGSGNISSSGVAAAAAAAASQMSSYTREGPFPAVDFIDAGPNANGLAHPVQRTASLLSEFQTFVDLDTRLETWKRNLLMPEDLRDDATEAKDISYFGTADHRRFMMRVRYFCLHCYYVPITIFLHQSNRPSFFTEYEQPLEVRLRQRRQKQKEQQPDHEQADDSDVRESEIALREMLNMAFASSWNEGLLAYDIEDRSWG